MSATTSVEKEVINEQGSVKKSCVLKVATVQKWINESLAKDNANIWLNYEADKQGHVQKLYCKLCTMKDFPNYEIQKIMLTKFETAQKSDCRCQENLLQTQSIAHSY